MRVRISLGVAVLSLGMLLFQGLVAQEEKPSGKPAGKFGGKPAGDPARPPAITAESVPNIPPELTARLAQYQEVRSAVFRGWSPDGEGILINTRFGDTPNLHRVYTPGGRREQITFFREPASGRFIPKGDGEILLSMSQGGSENDQVYLFDRKQGRAVLFTDGKSRNLLGPITKDGRQVIIGNNSRNGKDTDLYVADPRKPGKLKEVFQVDNAFWSVSDWSPDATKLLMMRVVSANESHPAIFDIMTQKITELPIPGEGPAAFDMLKYANDGKSIYLTSDANGEFTQLAQWTPPSANTSKTSDTKSGDTTSNGYKWLTADIPWDVEEIELHPDRDLLAFVVNEDGGSSLWLREGDKQSKVELPLGLVSGLEFSPDGEHLGMTFARPDAPADVYSLKLSDRTLTRWTYSEVGGLDVSKFVMPQLVRFPSFDDREIPAFYSRPSTASKEKPVPVLISIHGGPESQYRPMFSGIDQFYLNELGIAILSPNVRGSSGYGKTYLKLDNAELREDSVRDIGALLDWIAKQPELDKSRVAVIGGSYGGYMTLATLVHYGDRLRAGIDIVGIASFKSFLTNTAAYRQDLRRVEYGDERDPKMLAVFEKIDPLNHADKIISNLMVVHGKNDPRVPFSEAEQIAKEVRSKRKQNVWTIYAENEGHGFGKKANRDYLTSAIAMFLQTHLVETGD